MGCIYYVDLLFYGNLDLFYPGTSPDFSVQQQLWVHVVHKTSMSPYVTMQIAGLSLASTRCILTQSALAASSAASSLLTTSKQSASDS
jgi:hypothetical protein